MENDTCKYFIFFIFALLQLVKKCSFWKRANGCVQDLINRVQKFITSHDKPGSLSIILFTGYSVVGPLDAWISTPQLFLGGAVDTHNRLIQPTFNWTRNSNMLDCYDGGEVLVLLDCPCLFAEGSNHADAELLAAGVWDNDNAKDASTFGYCVGLKVQVSVPWISMLRY